MALTIDQLQIQIVAESNQATSAIDTLIGRLENLQAKLNVLGSAGKKVSNSLISTAKGAEKAAVATDKHRTSTDKASKSTKSFTDKLAQQISKYRTLMGAFSSAARMMAGWFNKSNDYIETVNLFNVTMGDTAPAAREFAESVERAMGIDSKDFMQYQGVFKNLTAGFGVSAEQADVMSQNLTQLSYDMASFFNADTVEEAFDKLSSAMAGQVKGLREYGIDTTVATLQEYALSKGIQTKVRNMTQAEKSLLRYNYIMEKSTHIQGDMARTLITPANAMKVLEAQLNRMKRAFGNIISVIVTKFIPYLQLVVEAITNAANAIASFLGFDASDYEAALPENAGFSGVFDDAEESAEGVSDSIKKIKKQLMGFDELNILSNPDSDSGSSSSDSGAGVGGALNGMQPLEYDFLKNLDTSKADAIKQQFKDIADAAVLMAKKISTALGFDEVWEIFSEGIAEIDFSPIVENAKTVFFNLKPIVGSAIEGMVSILKSWNVTISNAVMTIVTIVSDMFSGIMQGFADFTTQEKPLLDEHINGIVESWMLLDDSATTIIGGIFESVRTWWEVDGNSIWQGIVEVVGDLTAKLMEFWNDTIKPIIDNLSTTLTNLWNEHLAPLWENILNFIKSVWDFIKALWDGILKPIVNFVIEFVGPPIVNVFNHITDVIGTVIGVVADVVGGILKALGGVLDFLTGVFTGNWEKAWKGIKNFVTGIWNAIWGAIKGVINLVIDALNGLWRGLYSVLAGIINGVGGLIEDIGEIFGADWGWEIPSQPPLIPKLAGGGIVDAGQMFIAREAGPELVGSIGRKTAVANNDQIISGIESGVYRAMMAANTNNNGGSTQTIRIINEIDGDIVGEKVIQYHNGKVMQTGMSPLLV